MMSLVRCATALERHLILAPTKIIARSHVQEGASVSGPKRRPRRLELIPQAYRGPEKASFTRPWSRGREGTWVAGGGRRRVKQQQKPPHASANQRMERRLEERALKQQQLTDEKGSRLVALQQSLVHLAKDYRAILSPQSNAVDNLQMKEDEFKSVKKPKSFRKLVQTLAKRMKKALDGIHESDTPIEWSQIEETEDSFRGIFRVLQETVSLSAQLCKYCDWEASPGLVNLSEIALRSMLVFQSDRALVAESAKTWSSQSSSDKEIKSYLEFFSPTGGTEDDSSPMPEFVLAHNDPKLKVSADLFLLVMEALAAVDESSKKTIDGGHIDASTASRLVELLDLFPPNLVPSTDMGTLVLQTLAREGTRESAQTCFRLCQTGPSEIFRFSLVVEAFIRAVRHEEDLETRRQIVRECFDAINTHWNSCLPQDRLERIRHCTSVLQCLSFADILDDTSELFDTVEDLVKRTLGEQEYGQLMDDITVSDGDVNGRFDVHVLPLANFLIPVFAASDSSRVEVAKKMLLYLTRQKAPVASPSVIAFNSVLFAILQQCEKEGPGCESSAIEDLEYAFSVLDYLFGQTETESLPDGNTFHLLFRLVAAIKPDDIGERAQDLLSKMEISKCLSRTGTGKLSSLSNYHKVLWCWCEAAKSGSFEGVWRRGEKLVRVLELQSTPLILSDMDATNTTLRSLYNVNLRPLPRTYRFALNICAESTDYSEKKEEIASCALSVFRRMERRGFVSQDDDTVIEMFKRCIAPLPEESAQRKEAEAFLAQVTGTPVELSSDTIPVEITAE